MAAIKVVERDYGQTYNKFIGLPPLLTKLSNNVKGIDWNTEAEYKGTRHPQPHRAGRGRLQGACRPSKGTSPSATR